MTTNLSRLKKGQELIRKLDKTAADGGPEFARSALSMARFIVDLVECKDLGIMEAICSEMYATNLSFEKRGIDPVRRGQALSLMSVAMAARDLTISSGNDTAPCQASIEQPVSTPAPGGM